MIGVSGPTTDLVRARSTRTQFQDRAIVSVSADLMGGSVGVHVQPAAGTESEARFDARRALQRIRAWGDRLTRFTEASDLARLNADPRPAVPVRPTLAAVLDWGRAAEELTDGIVDITLLDARLAAETEPWARPLGGPSPTNGRGRDRGWSVSRGARTSTIQREPGVRFDLDGVAKGWLADRALGLLARHRSVVVDADGDIAIRLARGDRWAVGVADPRAEGLDLHVLDLAGPDALGAARSVRFGLATSGTSVHRWGRGRRVAHHLIDPRTARPALTDVVQATVLAPSAREAEALAKTAVILGSAGALRALDRAGVDGLILLTERDELLLTPATLRWLR